MEQTEIRYMDAIENHCKVDAILNGTKKVELNIDVDKFPLQAEAGVIGMKVGDFYKPTSKPPSPSENFPHAPRPCIAKILFALYRTGRMGEVLFE